MKQQEVNYFKLVFPMSVAIIFIGIGVKLLEYDTFWPRIIGYANILFFSGLIVFTLFRIYKQLKQPRL